MPSFLNRFGLDGKLFNWIIVSCTLAQSIRCKLTGTAHSSKMLRIVPHLTSNSTHMSVQVTSNPSECIAVPSSTIRLILTRNRYQQLLGCGNINLLNTSNLYARFTTSVICNAIVQNSIQECSLTGNAARPLCADSCVSD